MPDKIPKISNEVNTRLDEQTVRRALTEVKERLKTGRGPRAAIPQPTPPATRRERVRSTIGQVPDVARSVKEGFRGRFAEARRFTASRMKQVAETFGRGLTNIVMARRPDSQSEMPERAAQPAPPAVRQPQPAAPPVVPAPRTPPTPAAPPVVPQAVRPRQIPVLPPLGRTVNNFQTVVVIDPRRMKEWLEVLQLLEQLKKMNRALPKPVRPKVYEWMSEEEKRELEKTTFSQKGLEKAGWTKQDIETYLRAQSQRDQVYAQLDTRLRQMRIVDAQVRWREERRTRFRKIPGVKAPLGPSGAQRKPGQFYFNKRFQGATYSVPSMLQNRKMVAAARPQIELARQEQFKLLGMPYRALPIVSTKPARVFWPSKWGSGKPAIVGKQEAVDVLWAKQLGIVRGGHALVRPGSQTNQPLLRRLLQND